MEFPHVKSHRFLVINLCTTITVSRSQASVCAEWRIVSSSCADKVLPPRQPRSHSVPPTSKPSLYLTRETHRLHERPNYIFSHQMRCDLGTYMYIFHGWTSLFCLCSVVSDIAQSVTLETIETLAFNNLLNLSEISIQNTRSLMRIGRGTFNNLPKLRYLSISNTGITVFPDITSIYSLEPEFILDIYDNLYLLEIPPNAFIGLTKEYVTMNLYNNGIREIHDHAFNGTKIDKLVLKNNRNLRGIHRDAFKGATGPEVLDVSATALKKLPAEGLESVLVLFAQSAYALKSLPPLQGLWSLREAHLTYNSHCCALLSWSTHRDFTFNPAWNNGSTSCDESDSTAR
uniref:Luteinizing hormone/choriogonadotropin receptor n=1 Tax=Sparus aurata TaxID=8175 RepID=A0A671YRF1_SPAAU